MNQIAADSASAARFLAMLLGEPEPIVQASLTGPSRLHALGLAATPDGAFRLSDQLQPLQALRPALETEHDGAGGVLGFLRQPGLPWFFAKHPPLGLLREWFDQALADAMVAAMAGAAHSAEGVAALVRWSCGWPVPVAACEPLASRVTLLAIQTAVARLALELPAGTLLTGTVVIRALYAL